VTTLALALAHAGTAALLAQDFAYRPFIDPLDLHRHWWLLLPVIAFFIAMAYKAVRLPDLERYWHQVWVMTAQIILGLIALALGFYAIFQVYARLFFGG
jgi:hypothetical protein